MKDNACLFERKNNKDGTRWFAMKKQIVVCGVMLSALISSGCSISEADILAEDNSILSGESVESDTVKEHAVTDIQKEQNISDKKKILDAYEAAVTTLRENYLLPDGTEVQHDSIDPGENSYAICDIDGDETDELITVWNSAAMAGMQLGVYQYDISTGTYNEEITIFPTVRFYDNGLLLAEWSHNQGKGVDIWPYSIYRYDQKQDKYIYQGCVDSWSIEAGETDYPKEADREGYGSVYMIDYEGYDKDYYSKSEYDEFYEKLLDGAKEINIDYKILM